MWSERRRSCVDCDEGDPRATASAREPSRTASWFGPLVLAIVTSCTSWEDIADCGSGEKIEGFDYRQRFAVEGKQSAWDGRMKKSALCHGRVRMPVSKTRAIWS